MGFFRKLDETFWTVVHWLFLLVLLAGAGTFVYGVGWVIYQAIWGAPA